MKTTSTCLAFALAACAAPPATTPAPLGTGRATPHGSTLAPIGALPSPGATELAGAWTFMRFLGGPPEPGQITDTTQLDPAAGRHARIERNRAGAGKDHVCEADAPDSPAWTGLLTALADPDLRTAFAHPERVPLLPMDAGYFNCKHGGVAVWVSELAASDAKEPEITAAIRRLQQAYEAVHRELVALPACAGL